MALIDAFKLSMDIQLGPRVIVTPVLAKTHFKVLSASQKQKPKTSIIAQTSAKAVDSL